jgi:hypothetical protein
MSSTIRQTDRSFGWIFELTSNLSRLFRPGQAVSGWSRAYGKPRVEWQHGAVVWLLDRLVAALPCSQYRVVRFVSQLGETSTRAASS